MSERLISELLLLPERVRKGDFVLNLSEGVTEPEKTLGEYVVPPQLLACFDDALGFIRSAIDASNSKACYLHGSFGAGKSHFMAVLHLILQHNPAVRARDDLAKVCARHGWDEDRKFLLVPYHMIGARNMESAILGGYVDPIMQLHPDAPMLEGFHLICGQGERFLRFKDRPTIVGWMRGDEPDNAQSLGRGKGYGPPVPPERIVEGYGKIKKADPDRPVMLNLGQGVAWDGWHGRDVRTDHPEDYPEYLNGCDIASFDIDPACHEKEEIAGKLWYVPKGVDRLRRWTGGRKGVWCRIETTRIDNVDRKATPEQVRSEVWMALILGAKGLISFCHQFKPKFIEAGLLSDEEMARGVADLNRQIHELAPVLNSPDVASGASVTSSDERSRSTSWSSGMPAGRTCLPSPCGTGKRRRRSGSPIGAMSVSRCWPRAGRSGPSAAGGRTASPAISSISIGSPRNGRAIQEPETSHALEIVEDRDRGSRRVVSLPDLLRR